MNAESTIETLTRTLLYEGYALYPYHRSAIKNQKPVPFGVIFPQLYSTYNPHAHSLMQTQCIISGNKNINLKITVRFLHLVKTGLFENSADQDINTSDHLPLADIVVDGKSYHAGWQTIERTLSSGILLADQLIQNGKDMIIEFDSMTESRNLDNQNGESIAKQVYATTSIRGNVHINTVPIAGRENAFRITLTVTNATPVDNPMKISRDEVLSQSFLSTHALLETTNAKFISHQDPGEDWAPLIKACDNRNTWPILIDDEDTTLLSSPIILSDHPQINPLSHGDLFDGTEIEEALLLHVSVLSDEEKQRISLGDEKLKAMLTKVSQVTPEELLRFHSGLTENVENKNIDNPDL